MNISDHDSMDDDSDPEPPNTERCKVCSKRYCDRRTYYGPRSGETCTDIDDCGMCGAIQRIFEKVVSYEELEERFEDNPHIKIISVKEYGYKFLIKFCRI